jgi:DNA (cytosine-5)-methyltransferase 1
MPKKNSHITVTDQFCGAGGSGQGVKKVAEKNGGIEIKLALNHWKIATETYGTNFPNTLVDCTDISASDPRKYFSTTCMVTSPECRTHTPAGGNNHKALKKQMDLFNKNKIDPATERSRATMWDVCRFAEYHQYEFIIVENVVEAKTRWVLFDDWLRSMHTLGYMHKCVYLNSMHCHPTPQSRDRLYIVFWKKGNKAPNLEYNPTAYCMKCGKDINAIQTWKNQSKQFGKYRKSYVYCCSACTSIVEPYYYASFNCIDWSDLGERIGSRKTPLKPRTITRIKAGKEKFKDYPLLLHDLYGAEARNVVRPVSQPLFTQITLSTQALAVPPVPFIIQGNQTSKKPQLRTVFDVLQTQDTRQTMSLVTHEAWNSFIAAYNSGSHCVKHFTEELGTQPTGDRFSILNYPNEATIEDYYFRMLYPMEVKLGMAFDPSYKICGDSKAQVRQCGNAVTPPSMEMLFERCVQSLN